MSALESFVARIVANAADFVPSDLATNRQARSPETVIFDYLNLGNLAACFEGILGQKNVQEFYRDSGPESQEGTFHLTMPLAWLLSAYCRISDDKQRIMVNERQLLDSLARFSDCIKKGEVHYTINMRLTNIDIESDFNLAEGVRFQKILPEVIAQKYPIRNHLFPISPNQEKHWFNHCVEVVFSMQGKKMTDLQERSGSKHFEALVNSILHTFLLSNTAVKSFPTVTHILLDSPVDSSCLLRGIGAFKSRPQRLFSEDVAKIQGMYALLQNKDRILRTAIDRFILGKKRGKHHPNRGNEANWDKIVDYVIAMETLFLTVNGSAIAQELSYRFCLNGSSLLSRSSNSNVEQLFKALKQLYAIRSKVVHGCEDVAVLKPANKFIEILGIDCKDHQHSLGRLMLIANCVEKWLSDLMFYLESLDDTERPYRKAFGWEQMLWKPE